MPLCELCVSNLLFVVQEKNEVFKSSRDLAAVGPI